MKTLTQYLKWTMILTGTWRLHVSENKLIVNVYQAYSIFLQICLVLYCLSLILNLPILIKKKDYQMVIENVGYSIIMTVTIAKVIICQTGQVRELINRCILDERKLLNDNTNFMKYSFFLYVKQLSRVFLIVLPLPIVTLLTFYTASFKTYGQYTNLNTTIEKPLMLPLWFPFNYNEHYGLALCIGLFYSSLGAIYNVVTHILLLTLMTYSIWQLKALNIYGRKFHLFRQHFENGLIQKEEDNEILRSLKDICTKHQDIIRYVGQLNLAMGTVFLMEFLLNSLNIASFTIRAMMADSLTTLLFFILLLFHEIIQLFLMSWHANEIQLQSMSLSDSLFQSRWYEKSEKIKNTIFIMMIRCRKPLQLFIGPFYPISIRTAITTMKAAYSYITLILSLSLEDKKA